MNEIELYYPKAGGVLGPHAILRVRKMRYLTRINISKIESKIKEVGKTPIYENEKTSPKLIMYKLNNKKEKDFWEAIFKDVSEKTWVKEESSDEK